LLRLWLGLARRDSGAARKLMARAIAARDRPAAQAACEALLRADPGDIASIDNLARIHLEGGKPKVAHALYVRRARLLREPIEPRLYRNAYMVPGLVDNNEPYTHVLRDVLLETTYCAIFEGDRVYILETSGRNLGKHPYVRHRFTSDGEWFVVSHPDATRTIDEPVVLLGTDGGTNYSHWLTRYVLKLALLEEAGIAASVPLLINEDLRRYQYELLELVGIGQDRLLPVSSGIMLRCREIIVPVQLRNHPKMRLGIDWLRARLARCIEPASQAEDLLFVSRRDSPNHVLLNEAEIENELTGRGFKTVVLSEMPFADQVRSFSRARMIVGAHGAGLSNLIFAPSGATIVEITSTNLRQMNDFRFIAGQMGQKHFEIVANRYAEDQPAIYHPNYNYYADAGAVVEMVDKILEQ
jgi:capsular polysaccharide biosynthesis protein